ncbi:MAG TPA: ATP-dependent DNA ligase, partial [Metabacillus sp.]|nr:ATP-dependent DNA ligase [Metabacillus sp.]
MKELVKIFHELKNESSRNGKEAILKKYEDNELFKEVLKFVFNPYIVTGISTKKINKNIKLDEYVTIIRDIQGLMDYLKR